mmetsp:Transcript_13317/g.42102  ORF Transcript_13317/g.42102 Transcript_13317/m.42102 type:complete len:254 (+) Transcript_13317:1790-2551(+)
MVHMRARIMEVGAEKEAKAPQRLSISSCIWPSEASGTRCSSTRMIFVPSTPSEPEPRWLPAAARPPRPPRSPPAGALKSIQALSTRSKRIALGCMLVTSSSIDQTAVGHSQRGRGLKLSCTMYTSASTKRCGKLPSLRFESCRRPRWRYSTASESKLANTAGKPPAPQSPRLPARASASSASGFSTAASSSSKARSATLSSTSRTSGSTFFTQISQTRGWGQVRSKSARLETQDLRTRMDSSAERLAKTFTSK